jgi:hypothetical protein
MNVKKDEFRSLRQGGRSLKEYMDDLCALSRYAPDDVDTDAKRKEKFLNGLKGELKIPLSVAYAPNYQSLPDQAITLDNNIMKEENRKRKFRNGRTHIEPFHKRHHFSEGNGNGSNSNGHRHNGGNKGNNSNGHHNGNNGQHSHNSEAKKDLSHITCFNCKKKGHYSTNCPENKSDEPAKPNPFKKGYVNHINVEEVMGMFPFNSFRALDFI